MQHKFNKQRKLYKFLESISIKQFTSEIELLTAIVQEVSDNHDFGILGGRIWKFDSLSHNYILNYQYGKLKKIKENHKINTLNVEISTVMKKLYKKRTIIEDETDEVLIKSGVQKYSLTGVGEILKTQYGKYYEYVLGFNADDFNDEFFDSISVISSVSTIAIRNYGPQNDEQKKIERDFLKAKEIQQNILPDHSTTFLDYEIFGICIPDSVVGGDYFDYIRNTDSIMDEETLSIVISDAASKGLAAAIQSLFVSGAIRMGMALASRMSHTMGVLNKLIHQTFPYDRFVTLFMCELTRSQNRLITYTNAGHCAPIHYRCELDNFVELMPTGGLLGIVDNQQFGVENIRMHKGDVLLLYTDGISEAQDDMGNLYGEDRIKEVIKKYSKESAQKIVYHIIDDVVHYSKNANYSDDRTLVVIKRLLDGEEEK